MTPGRRHLGHAELIVEMPGTALSKLENADRLRVLTHFNVADVKRRGHGHGSRLLAKVCREADTQGNVLMLEVRPYDEAERSAEQLSAWYARYGFRTVQSEPAMLMARAPKAVFR